MDVRPPGLLQCGANAVGQQCGEEIGNHLQEAASWIQAQCSQTAKLQRGKKLHLNMHSALHGARGVPPLQKSCPPRLAPNICVSYVMHYLRYS